VLEINTKYRCLSLLLILLLGLSIIPTVFAEDQGVVCAEIVPCASDGSVLAPFDQDPVCSQYYKSICSTKLFNQVTENYIACEDDRSSLRAQNKRLRRRLLRKRGANRHNQK